MKLSSRILNFWSFGLLLAIPLAVCRGGSNESINVVLLMTDEHTPRVLGCYGDPLVKTPTLDALAATGVRFTAAYCQDPICVPSRVSLVSGRMPCHQNTFGNTPNQRYSGVETLADVFAKAGYRTAWFGKAHWGEPRFQETGNTVSEKRAIAEELEEKIGRQPQEAEVSSWPAERNPEHQTTETALAFLERNRDKPFFLGVSFSKPHFPFTIQENYYALYRDKVLPPHAEQNLIDELPAVSKLERARFGLDRASEKDVLCAKAIYYGMVTYVDDEFGRIVKKLDELGLRGRTLILYTADHGEMLGERGLWYKNSFYDGSASIPFIWSYPAALPQGKVIAAPAMNMDIFPTLCEICKLPKPEGLEGRSLVPVMTGVEDGQDRYALSENYRDGYAGRMIRTPRWKYFFYTDGEEYLYDLQADPGEVHNRVKDPQFRSLVDELKLKASAGWISSVPKKAKEKHPRAK
jgi:choline-sulfatase